jgi:hypothetical protein
MFAMQSPPAISIVGGRLWIRCGRVAFLFYFASDGVAEALQAFLVKFVGGERECSGQVGIRFAIVLSSAEDCHAHLFVQLERFGVVTDTFF